MVKSRQIYSSAFVAVLAVGLAGSAIAEPSQTPKPPSDAQLLAFRVQIKGYILECIREKIASPDVCRMSAYATALAAGWPPELAAQVTDYRPE